MLSSSVFLFSTWLLYHYATSCTMVVVARILYSLMSGGLKTTISTYISEISEPQLRGRFQATNHLAATIGMFFSLLMGSLMYWRTIAFINLAFPVISFITVLFVPDSPVWLASKGRFDDAANALSWFRGWVKPTHVRSEYQSLIENFQKSEVHHVSNSSIVVENKKDNSKKFFKPFLHRSFYRPLALVFLTYFIHFFSGVAVVLNYSMVIFKKMNSPIDESVATAIMGAMRILGALVILLSIRHTGKRKLIFITITIAGSCYFVIAVIGFLIQKQQLHSDAYLWISPIAMILAVFANSAGVEPIVHMLNSEIFPSSIRIVSASIGYSISSIMQSIMGKAFLYMVDGITMPGVFFYFSVMNAIAIVIYHFILPETEGRSLKEIEDHYRGVKNLNDG